MYGFLFEMWGIKVSGDCGIGLKMIMFIRILRIFVLFMVCAIRAAAGSERSDHHVIWIEKLFGKRWREAWHGIAWLARYVYYFMTL